MDLCDCSPSHFQVNLPQGTRRRGAQVSFFLCFPRGRRILRATDGRTSISRSFCASSIVFWRETDGAAALPTFQVSIRAWLCVTKFHRAAAAADITIILLVVACRFQLSACVSITMRDFGFPPSSSVRSAAAVVAAEVAFESAERATNHRQPPSSATTTSPPTRACRGRAGSEVSVIRRPNERK